MANKENKESKINGGLKACIKSKDLKGLKKIIKTAQKNYKEDCINSIKDGELTCYPGESTEECTICTTTGEIPISMIMSKKALWENITEAYVEVLKDIEHEINSGKLSKKDDKAEIKRIVNATIATNDVFSSLVLESTNEISELL